MRRFSFFVCALMLSTTAVTGASAPTVKALLEQGYEVVAGGLATKGLLLFLKKDKVLYACNLTADKTLTVMATRQCLLVE